MTMKIDEKKEPEVIEVSDSEFELMFAKESGVEPEATDTSAAKETVEETVEEKVEEKAEETAEETKAEEKAEEKVEEKAEEKVEEKAPTAEEIAAEQKKRQDAEAEKTRLAEEKKQKDDALAARATLAEDEKALLAETQKDFPDVAKVMEIQQRIADAKWEQRFEAFQKDLNDKLSPAMQAVNAVAGDAFEKAVYGKHPDTQEILPDVEAWVDKQPAFLKAAYNNVLDNGTAAETIELLDIFKTATGKVEAKEDPAEVARKEKEAEEKERKLASQEGVRSRQAPAKELAPTDFEGAFEKEAAKAVA
jgi:hypothetical protein